MQITVIKQDRELCEVRIVVNQASGLDNIDDVINVLEGHPYLHRRLGLGSYITAGFCLTSDQCDWMVEGNERGDGLMALRFARNWHNLNVSQEDYCRTGHGR